MLFRIAVTKKKKKKKGKKLLVRMWKIWNPCTLLVRM